MCLSKCKEQFIQYIKKLDNIRLLKEYDSLELLTCLSLQHEEMFFLSDDFGDYQELVADEIISRFAEMCNDESVYRFHEGVQSLLFNWDGEKYPPDSDSSALCAAEEPASL